MSTPALRSMLHAIQREDMALLRRMVQEDGVDVKSRLTDDGQTPLHVAASMCNYGAIKFLFENNADANALTDSGVTPLSSYFSCEVFNDSRLHGARAAYFLINECNAYCSHPIDGGAALHRAIRGNHGIEIFQYIIDHSDDTPKDYMNGTLLRAAVQYYASLEVVQCVIDHKVDINASCETSGQTALHIAFLFGADLEVVQLLISCNPDINAIDKDGCTPLHCGASKGGVSAPFIPLHRGAISKGVSAPFMALLLAHGADVCIRDKKRQTPLHGLVESNNIGAVTLFLEYVRLNYGAAMMESVLAVANLEQESLPFHCVQSLEMAKLLLEQPVFEDDEVVPRVCYYMLFARDANGRTLLELDQRRSSGALHEYLTSYTDLSIAVPERPVSPSSNCDEQGTTQKYELAVRVNPMLNDFQCITAVAFIDKWKGWSTLFYHDGNAVSEDIHQEDLYVLPDEIKY